MEKLRAITWAVVGIIMAVGVVLLTFYRDFPPEVFAALAGVAINAIFRDKSGASLRKENQQLLAEFKSMVANKQ